MYEQVLLLKERLDKNEIGMRAAEVEILKPTYFDSKVKPVKLSRQFLSKHFKPEQSTEEIEKIISAALDIYFAAEDRMDDT